MKAFIIAVALMLVAVSCAETEGQITSYQKGQAIGTFRVRQWVYGKLNSEILPFGVTHSGNLDIGFKTLTQGLTALATAVYYGQVQIAKEITSRLATQGLNQVELARVQSALQQSISKNGLDATIAGINGGLFTPAGTVFKQPGL